MQKEKNPWAVAGRIGVFAVCAALILGGCMAMRLAFRKAQAPAAVYGDGDGYVFRLPPGWIAERSGEHYFSAREGAAVANASSSMFCRVEMWSFPYVAGTNAAQWISSHIGADPSLSMVERSSVAVPVAGGSAVRWEGEIDGATTTLVYAFNGQGGRAYEIAPSPVNGTSSGNAPCVPALEKFISVLTLQ